MFPKLGSSQQEAAVIVGFFLPLVLAIPIQEHWPNTIRTLFAVGAYAAAGALVAAAAGKLTGKTFWEVTLEVLTLGVIGYQGVWKPSGLAPAIESATSTNPSGSQTARGVPPANPSPSPAGAGTGGAGGGGGGGGSPLETQIVELLGATVKLLEHATERIAATTPVETIATPAVLPAPVQAHTNGAPSSPVAITPQDATEPASRGTIESAPERASQSPSEPAPQPAAEVAAEPVTVQRW